MVEALGAAPRSCVYKTHALLLSYASLLKNMVTATGFEPANVGLKTRCLSPLGYAAWYSVGESNSYFHREKVAS